MENKSRESESEIVIPKERKKGFRNGNSYKRNIIKRYRVRDRSYRGKKVAEKKIWFAMQVTIFLLV